jgi:hypothetical protein
MELARAASSGYAEKLTLKGTASQQAKHYAMHAMFLLASVNLPEMTAMDESRWAMVQLREAARAPAAKEADKDHFDELLRKLDRWPEDIGDLLAGRALLHWRAILANYRTLRRIVAERLTPRLGDTYGMLLAGAHFLTDAGELTPAAAARLVDAIEWDEAEQLSSDSDAQRYLSFVASRVVKVASFQGPPLERTIRDLVQVVAAKSSQGVGVPIEEAERVLGALGIRVAEKIMTSRGSIYGRGGERSDLRLWLAREGGNLPSLLRGTQWSGNHLGPLRTLEDVATSANKMGFRGLRPSYGVGIPLREILGDDAPEGGAEQSTTNTTTGSGDEIPF